MMRKTLEEKYIVFLKYIYIAIFIIFMLLKENLSTFQVIILLLYIINNQVRFFLFKSRRVYSYASYIVEFAVSCIMFSFASEFSYLVFMPAFIDIAITLPNVVTVLYFTLIVLFNLQQSNGIHTVLPLILCSLPILILGGIVRDEYEEKIKAQHLYDKLREREEELKEANTELENYANTIEEITLLRERNRISREIHDNVGHALSTIMIQLGAIGNIAPVNGKAAAEMANNLSKFADESLQSVRAAVRSMKPREFEEYEGIVSISEMIKNFEKLSAIKVMLRVSDKFWKLNADQTMVIYRIIQEFLSNCIRHGKATEVKIFLNFLENNLRIYIKDNGVGCSDITEGTGLRSIRERVKVWGGNLEYYSEKGKGFEVIATLERGSLKFTTEIGRDNYGQD